MEKKTIRDRNTGLTASFLETEILGKRHKGIFKYQKFERIISRRADHYEPTILYVTRQFAGRVLLTNLGSGKKRRIDFVTDHMSADRENQAKIDNMRKIELEGWLTTCSSVWIRGYGWFIPELVKGTENDFKDYVLERILYLKKQKRKNIETYGDFKGKLKISRLDQDDVKSLIKRGVLTSYDRQASLIFDH